MSEYPEALVEKVAQALYAAGGRGPDEEGVALALLRSQASTVLGLLGFAPYTGPSYWRSAIHVEGK